jgi:hypothetical protein
VLGSVTFKMVVAAVRRDPAVAALAAIICVAFGVMAILSRVQQRPARSSQRAR